MLADERALAPSGLHESVTAWLLRLIIRVALLPAMSPTVPMARQRRRLEWVMRWTRLFLRANIKPAEAGGVSGEWVRTRRTADPAQDRGAILYLHGGGYCFGSPATHRALTAHLAAAARLPLFAPDYRLAPEHPFPAAVEDAVAAYAALRAAGPVVLAGDSAGGGLVLAAALTARERGLAPPSALVLFSPWVDLADTAIPASPPAGEAMLKPAWVHACARLYLVDDSASHPLASPLHGDLRDLPPVLIQAGTDELLNEQSLRLHDALVQAGVDVCCEIVPRRWHVFQLHAGMLPSANAALLRAGRFIRKKTAA